MAGALNRRNFMSTVSVARASSGCEYDRVVGVDEDEIRRFVQAVGRGYESVRSDPQGAVQNLVRMNAGLDPKFQLASVRATLPVFFPASASQPWGFQDPAQWSAYGQWMLSQHLISSANAPVDASTNELLAGKGI